MTKHDPVLHNATCVLIVLALVVMIVGLLTLRPSPDTYGQRVNFDRATGKLEFVR